MLVVVPEMEQRHSLHSRRAKAQSVADGSVRGSHSVRPLVEEEQRE